MLANNDAGGMISYAVTGATFGIGWFIQFLLLLAPIGYSVQEMSMRLAAVTRTDYAKLVRAHFGRVPAICSVAALLAANSLYMITEFAGMTAGLSALGLRLWASDAASLSVVSGVAMLSGYRGKRHLAVALGALSGVSIVVAFLAHPSPAALGGAFSSRPARGTSVGPDLTLLLIVAAVGNAVAPFMLYFASGAVTEVRLTSRDLRFGRVDAAVGSLLQTAVAIAVVVCGAAIGSGVLPSIGDPRKLILGLLHAVGTVGGDLFAVALAGAGALAAITISFATAYAVSGARACRAGMHSGITEAPLFYWIYFGMLVLGATAILIPGLPLMMIAVFAQIGGAALLVPDLVMLVLLTSNRTVMKRHVNPAWKTMVGLSIVVLYFGVSGAVLAFSLQKFH